MADDNTPHFPKRRRPGQTYEPPSQAELDAREDRARTDPDTKPRIDPRAAVLLTPEAEAYKNVAQALYYVDNALGTELGRSHQYANMGNVDKVFQANLSKMQDNLDELAKTDRNLAFSVADALSDSVRTNQNKVEVKVEGKSADVAETLAKALGQDTLNDIKALFSDQNYAFTDTSTGKSVEPSSNIKTADKIVEQAAPQSGRS